MFWQASSRQHRGRWTTFEFSSAPGCGHCASRADGRKRRWPSAPTCTGRSSAASSVVAKTLGSIRSAGSRMPWEFPWASCCGHREGVSESARACAETKGCLVVTSRAHGSLDECLSLARQSVADSAASTIGFAQPGVRPSTTVSPGRGRRTRPLSTCSTSTGSGTALPIAASPELSYTCRAAR